MAGNKSWMMWVGLAVIAVLVLLIVWNVWSNCNDECTKPAPTDALATCVKPDITAVPTTADGELVTVTGTGLNAVTGVYVVDSSKENERVVSYFVDEEGLKFTAPFDLSTGASVTFHHACGTKLFTIE